jgi:MarR family transcriptional regulator, organic hydroperoxide resistance regulator
MKKKAVLIGDIVDNLRRVFQAVNEHSKKAEAITGITGPQLWAIKTIAEFAPIKVSDLAKKIYLHPATVVGILDRLETRGMVTRVRSKNDRRVVKINLTDLGRELVSKAPQVAQGLIVGGLEVLANKELANISTVLDQLVQILGAQELPPQLILSQEINISRKKPVTVSRPKT